MFEIQRLFATGAVAASLLLAVGPGRAADPAPTTSPPPAASTTVGAVVVNATPAPKRCSERDKPCIEATAQLLWTRFPTETQKWCSDQEAKVMAKSFQMESLAEAFGDEGPAGVGVSHSLPEPVKIVCDYPKEAAKAAGAAAKPGP